MDIFGLFLGEDGAACHLDTQSCKNPPKMSLHSTCLNIAPTIPTQQIMEAYER